MRGGVHGGGVRRSPGSGTPERGYHPSAGAWSSIRPAGSHTRPSTAFRSATQVPGEIQARDPDRVADARVPQLTAVNQAVHGCRTHPQLPSYLGNGEPRHSVGQELTTTRSSLAGARDCGGQVVRDVMGLYWGFAHAKLSQSGRTVVRTALANRPIF